MKRLAIGCMCCTLAQHRAAPGREHDVLFRGQVGDHAFLPVPEGGFALDFEDRRDRYAETALELVIGVDEAAAEPARQLPAKGRLARAGQAHQKQIAPMQLHRGIVSQSADADEASAPVGYLTEVTVSLTTRGVRKISSSVFSFDLPVVLNR